MKYCGIYNVDCTGFILPGRTVNRLARLDSPLSPKMFKDICLSDRGCKFQRVAESEQEALDAYYRSRQINLLEMLNNNIHK